MHPTTALFLANDHIAELSRAAERERLARTARASRRPGRRIGRLVDQLARREAQPSGISC